MAKPRTVYVCAECGGTSLKWQGKCPHCAAWNTLEETVESASPAAAAHRYAPLASSSPVRSLADIEARETDRKSVVSGKSVSVRVDLGGPRIIKKTKTHTTSKVRKQ